ncbi:MAG: type II secretion system F family protein [Candidatus Vogelbacteria bacterium]|nr:type II secretion system F family protein [Candidatus Vogelbacteria bacterium]
MNRLFQHHTKWSIKEQSFFAKRLSFLMSAGLPLLDSLQLLHRQTNVRSRSNKVLDTLIDDIASGYYLSKSLARFPTIFGQFAVNIVKIGEESGILSQNLNYLAAELKKKQILRRKIISALIYPIIITLATLGITAFLMIYLFPKIMPIFTSLRVDLPLSTKIVIAISSFLHHWGLASLIGLSSSLIILATTIKKNRPIRRWYEKLLLKLPVLGTMIKNYNLANASRTLSLLLQSNMTLNGALAITAETSENLIFKNTWQTWAEIANRGECLDFALNKEGTKVLPDIFKQLVSVGEVSGNLADTLMYLSELYEQELDDITKDLSTMIEPALMIFMGLLIGFIAISIITPIYSLTQNLHG